MVIYRHIFVPGLIRADARRAGEPSLFTTASQACRRDAEDVPKMPTKMPTPRRFEDVDNTADRHIVTFLEMVALRCVSACVQAFQQSPHTNTRCTPSPTAAEGGRRINRLYSTQSRSSLSPHRCIRSPWWKLFAFACLPIINTAIIYSIRQIFFF